jgi:solute carrier family 25 (mitochondrial S-adenosylmethionine transporter), member 26
LPPSFNPLDARQYLALAAAQCKQATVPLSPCSTPVALHPLAVDAISGAVGEVISLIALYPLDTLKVLCQARGASTGAVLASLMAAGPSAATAALYAGVGSAAMGAAAVGSVYFLAFQMMRRGVAADGSAASASLAGAAASVAGSLVESPVEFFKVRAQAGALGGSPSMFGAMWTAAATRGVAGLYCSLLPFLLKSLPNDVAELCTFSQLSGLKASHAGDAATAKEDGWRRRIVGVLAGMPDGAADAAMGAIAGAAAAVASMPMDVVFTRMACEAGLGPVSGAACASAASRSPLQSATAFAETAKCIVAQGGGPQVLFAGLGPRLLQTVPAAMVYWATVEATRRALSGCAGGNDAARGSKQHEAMVAPTGMAAIAC